MVQTNKLLNEHEVNNLFSRVAPRYDLLNNVISLGTQKIWRHELFNQLQIKPTDNALDVAVERETSQLPWLSGSLLDE